MNAPQANDQKLGEGFAFYRWHVSRFRESYHTCSYPDRTNVCADAWDEMRAEALSALQEARS